MRCLCFIHVTCYLLVPDSDRQHSFTDSRRLRGFAFVPLERETVALEDSLFLDQELVNGPHECLYLNGFFQSNEVVLCYLCLEKRTETCAHDDSWKSFQSFHEMQVVVKLKSSQRGQSVVEYQQVNVHVLHQAKHLCTISGQENAMSTCLLHAFLQKSGVLFIALSKEDGFSYERLTCLYSAVLIASIAPYDEEVLVQSSSKLLDQSLMLLLGLAIVLQRFARGRCARMLPQLG